jgi:transcriptional regulator with XRE-family HTH domain
MVSGLDEPGERQRLAAALRALRRDAGLSGEGLAGLLGWSQSKVSKIENGRTRPAVADVMAWADATGAGEEARSALVGLVEAASAQTVSWWASHRAGLAARQREVAEVEARTVRLWNFQPAVVPGLLQTAGYARRVLALADVSGQRDVAAAVTARLERQAVLYDEGRQFEFVLTEAALRWRPGPPGLLLAQLDRLLSMATLPNVRLGVVPWDREAAAAPANGFTVFDTGEEAVVLVETLSTESFLTGERHLEVYRQAFDRFREAAFFGEDAATAITTIKQHSYSKIQGRDRDGS